MKDFFRFISDLIDDLGVYKVSLIVLSFLFFLFDIYQVATSPTTALALIACACLLVSILGHAGFIGLPGVMYGLAYLAPLSLWIVGSLLDIYPALGNSSDYKISALATALSAVVPPIGAGFTFLVIHVMRRF